MPKPGRHQHYPSAYEQTAPEPSGLATTASGCGFLLFVLVVTTVMLIINAIVCLSIHSAVMSFGPSYMRDKAGFGPHIAQLFFFVVPVILTIIQWNLLDRLNRMFRGRGR